MADGQVDHSTSSPPSVTSWTKWHTWSLVFIVVAAVLLGLFTPLHSKLWTWLVTLLLLVAFSAIAGQGITGRWSGLLIDERNMMSLSRLQMFFWTTLVLSGLMTAAISNVATNQTDPLAIAVPQELWILMGISTTTLVATPLVLNPKKTATLSETEEAQLRWAGCLPQQREDRRLSRRGREHGGPDGHQSRGAPDRAGDLSGLERNLYLSIQAASWPVSCILPLSFSAPCAAIGVGGKEAWNKT